MKRQDLHLHTKYSADSLAEPRAYCLRAIERGYDAICFTDHADFEKEDMGYGFFDYDRYRGAVEACRTEFAGRLRIGFGVEIDYHHSWEKEIQGFLAGKAFDYVLGGVHYLAEHILVMEQSYFTGKSQRQTYAAYFQEVRRLVDSGLCQGLAHLDMIKRGGMPVYGAYRPADYAEFLVPLLAGMIRQGMALEINLSGLRQGLGEPLPGLEVVDLYAAAGGRRVSVGSDAHRPADSCPDYPDIWRFVEEKGLELVELVKEKDKPR